MREKKILNDFNQITLQSTRSRNIFGFFNSIQYVPITRVVNGLSVFHFVDELIQQKLSLPTLFGRHGCFSRLYVSFYQRHGLVCFLQYTTIKTSYGVVPATKYSSATAF